MIGIIDYGLGNINAFANIYRRLNIPAIIARNVESLEKADRIILPGVGSFDWAMQRLDHSGMRHKLDEMVLQKRIPVLGVCVGMQMMAKNSEEGREAGLGWIDATVKRLYCYPDNAHLILPHMGWNSITNTRQTRLLEKLTTTSRFYFLHSYYFIPNNEDNVIATTQYGTIFTCAVQADNCYGVQFHPEKSHSYGTQLLRNFAEI